MAKIQNCINSGTPLSDLPATRRRNYRNIFGGSAWCRSVSRRTPLLSANYEGRRVVPEARATRFPFPRRDEDGIIQYACADPAAAGGTVRVLRRTNDTNCKPAIQQFLRRQMTTWIRFTSAEPLSGNINNVSRSNCNNAGDGVK